MISPSLLSHHPDHRNEFFFPQFQVTFSTRHLFLAKGATDVMEVRVFLALLYFDDAGDTRRGTCYGVPGAGSIGNRLNFAYAKPLLTFRTVTCI
jgi:hypothetical protein